MSMKDQLLALIEARQAGEITALELLAGLDDLQAQSQTRFFELVYTLLCRRGRFGLIGGRLA